MTATLVRIEWPDGPLGHPVHNRWYADSWHDVQAVLDELDPADRNAIRAIHWPDEKEV